MSALPPQKTKKIIGSALKLGRRLANLISADRDWAGNSLHAFFTKYLEAIVRRECIRDRARTADAVRPNSFLHPGCDIDRIAIDTEMPVLHRDIAVEFDQGSMRRLWVADVRFGSKADMCSALADVR